MPPSPTASERSPLLRQSKGKFAASERGVVRFLDSNSDDTTSDTSSASSSPLSSESESVLLDIERDAVPSSSTSPGSALALIKVVALLLLGAFTSNADSSLVLVTYSTIASELNHLKDASWLFNAFVLAGGATQAIYGKLSGVYGAKSLLLASYVMFGIGCAMVGSGQYMWHVILGRVVCGLGGSAMTVATALLITDLVPLRDIAAWQSGVNLVATVGRSLGGPLGGFLADTIGWRWSFLGQAPIFIFGAVLCGVYLSSGKLSPAGDRNDADHDGESSDGHKDVPSLARIDFLGAALLALLILTFLLPIQLGGSKLPWSHPFIPALFGTSAVLALVFVLVESRWAKEPIFPLNLLMHRDVVLSYAVMGLQGAAQLGLMFCVPLYFRVTENVSNTVAGAHLIPSVAGNAFGTILTGTLIKRSGRYKNILVIATISTSFSYMLLMLRWHGHTNIWESLYIVPAGFGTGVAQAATFISTQAAVDKEHKAVATGGLYLSVQIGLVVGLAAVSTVMLEGMRQSLDGRLLAIGFKPLLRQQIIDKAASSVSYINEAQDSVAAAVSGAYVDGLGRSHVVSFLCSTLAFVAAMMIREHKL